jgi:hypothetical protein
MWSYATLRAEDNLHFSLQHSLSCPETPEIPGIVQGSFFFSERLQLAGLHRSDCDAVSFD